MNLDGTLKEHLCFKSCPNCGEDVRTNPHKNCMTCDCHTHFKDGQHWPGCVHHKEKAESEKSPSTSDGDEAQGHPGRNAVDSIAH